MEKRMFDILRIIWVRTKSRLIWKVEEVVSGLVEANVIGEDRKLDVRNE